MGRIDRYSTHVQPYLNDIKEWYKTLNEVDIANKLGVSARTWARYKTAHPELIEALRDGKKELCQTLKDALKKKAQGFYYTETKTTQRRENGKTVIVREEYNKYAQPDTGAIHLLLKNLDPEWRNDDAATMELKRQQLELQKEKQEAAAW